MKPPAKPFALCINNTDRDHFVLVDFPKAVKKKILAVAGAP